MTFHDPRYYEDDDGYVIWMEPDRDFRRFRFRRYECKAAVEDLKQVLLETIVVTANVQDLAYLTFSESDETIYRPIEL